MNEESIVPPEATSEVPAWAAEAVALCIADRRSEETQRAYRADLDAFFAWAGRANSPAAVQWLCSLPAGPLALLLNGYKAELRAYGRAEATINRKLSAVRSLLRFARRLGASCPDPAGLVSSEKVISYRDTRGPGLEAAAKLLAAVDRSTLSGKRDAAMLTLFCENALRRGELHRANVGDLDVRGQRLWIIGKGRGSQKESITLSSEGVGALEEYIRARRANGEEITHDSPLFVGYGRGMRTSDGRLTGRGLWHIVNRYGQTVLGQPLHPHGLRHTAITATLDATHGDIRTAQRLSRHKDIRTLTLYDDNREDLQGEATRLLSDLLKRRE